MKSIYDQEATDEIIKRLSNLDTKDRPVFGKLTPSEAVCHLIDTFEGATNPENEKAFEKSFFSTKFGQWFIICSPFPWPKGRIKVREPIEKVFFKTKPSEDFEKDKEKLIELIKDFKNIPEEKLTKNPTFGELSPEMWAKLHYRHLNHHLIQFGK